MSGSLLPALDQAGMPGPPWLFHVLLVFTFFLHALFMNMAMGGTLLAWAAHMAAGRKEGAPERLLASRLNAANTFAISMAITTGVAPLLFIQLLYQRFFYSGTILMGWAWFGLLGLLIAGYYGAYAYSFRGAPARGTGGGLWLGLAAIAFLLIGMIQVGANLIHSQPGLWSRFDANPWVVLADPSYWPRLLHFVFAGVGFAALVMGWWASRRAAAGDDVETNRIVARTCWRWVLWTVVLQVVDGFVLLILLPREVMLGIMRGGAATLLPLTASILLGVGLLVMVARTAEPAGRHKMVTGILAAMTLTIAVMSITRHQVRALYLDAFADAAGERIVPQWGNFALFVLVLLIALATVAVMIRRVLAEPAAGEEAA